MREAIELELEIDSSPIRTPLFDEQRVWQGSGASKDVVITLVGEEEGHGFGLSEVVTITVSIGAGVASNIAADAIRAAVGKVIRRARGRSRYADGSVAGLTDLIESERSDPDKE